MWFVSAFAAPAVQVPEFDPSRSLAPLVDAVSPAVVALEVESVQRLPDLPAAILERLPMDPHRLPQTRSSEGSGFFVSPDGELVTNWHVVDGASRVTVVTADGRRVPARVLGGDPALDVALLKVDGAEPWLELAGADAPQRVGDWVLAMGNGLGLGVSATVGIVSGRGRHVNHDVLSADFLQTDAAINEGASGGPVFTLDGAVIGMSTATVIGANTVGFAVPAASIRAAIEDLRAVGYVRRGYLGLSPGDHDGAGAIVVDVQDGTPAAKGGLKAGDVIRTVDGEGIDDARDLVVTVAGRRPGVGVDVVVEREGKERTLRVELGSRPDTRVTAAAVTPPDVTRSDVHELHQLTVRSTQPSTERGVEVVEVRATSPFAGRLRAGDHIVTVNHRPVATARDVADAITRSGGELSFELVRDGVTRTVSATLPD